MSLSVTGNSTAIYRKNFNDTPYCTWYQMKEGSANYQMRPFWPVDGSKQKFYNSTKTSMCFGKLTCHWARAEEKARQVNLPLVLKGLKSDVTTRDHMVRCRGSQECGSRNVNFACKFHRPSHRVRITLKSTTLLFMRTRNVWTTKPWQRS